MYWVTVATNIMLTLGPAVMPLIYLYIYHVVRKLCGRACDPVAVAFDSFREVKVLL